MGNRSNEKIFKNSTILISLFWKYSPGLKSENKIKESGGDYDTNRINKDIPDTAGTSNYKCLMKFIQWGGQNTGGYRNGEKEFSGYKSTGEGNYET